MLRAKVSYSSNGQHTSRSDPKAHFTVDVYGEEDKPIGVMHVYPPAKGDKGTLKLFSSPRKKAFQVSWTCFRQSPDWFCRHGESDKLPLESQLDYLWYRQLPDWTIQLVFFMEAVPCTNGSNCQPQNLELDLVRDQVMACWEVVILVEVWTDLLENHWGHGGWFWWNSWIENSVVFALWGYALRVRDKKGSINMILHTHL